jgi:hypothetical protein
MDWIGADRGEWKSLCVNIRPSAFFIQHFRVTGGGDFCTEPSADPIPTLHVCACVLWEGKGDAVPAGGKELISASIFLPIHQHLGMGSRSESAAERAKNNHHNNGRHHAALAIYYRPDYVRPWVQRGAHGARLNAKHPHVPPPGSTTGKVWTEYIFTACQIWRKIGWRSKLNLVKIKN